jgi:hypothetical protein
VDDMKRCTWVTAENFLKIYENVYYAMVEAGVALKSEWWTQVLVGQHSIC